MRSRTSCFNATVFRKNLLRFAPVWGVYTLCLVMGILLMYTNGGDMKQYYFARHMTDLVEVMALVNLVYAPIVAALLFGDLYSSRMCNMLHAFPLRRENWFVTHVVSGMACSLVPTLVMALVSFPLLMGSLFEGAVALSWWIFLASNLQFACFFGMAVFCVMVVGNRFAMLASYGLLNAGAAIAYWLIDTVYTPMLYGVITPTALSELLTPIHHMVNQQYIEVSAELYLLREMFGEQLRGAVASYTITDQWWRLWMLSGVGLVFALLGLGLYKIRNLECAGSMVAFPVLRPVFEVLCAIFIAAAAQFFLCNFVGMSERNFLILTVGLAAGWFIGKMLTEHTSRVFHLRNCCGLAALAAVFAASLWLTHVDILKIETTLPEADQILRVTFNGTEYTQREDIDNFLVLQADALENRAEEAGLYVLVDGQWIQRYSDPDAEYPDASFTYVDSARLTYEMKNGKLIDRRYNIWVDNAYVRSEAGRIAEDYLTRWETINDQKVLVNGVEYNRLDLVLENIQGIYVDYMDIKGQDTRPQQAALAQDVDSLIAAMKADCAAGNMAQNYMYHTGSFRMEDDYSEKGYYDFPELGISISSENYNWWVSIYPDSIHTLEWLRDHGVLNAEVRPESIPY